MGPDKDVSGEMQAEVAERETTKPAAYGLLGHPLHMALLRPSLLSTSGHPDRRLPNTELWFDLQGFLC